MLVALGKAIVVFAVVAVPVEPPIVKVVAEPNNIAVVAAPNTPKEAGFAAENTVVKPEEPLITVALEKDTVVF
jgi:hypothetical protein